MAKALLVEADDYCGGLSGGQRAKLELIRSVFLRPVCPPLLMLDEPFAALDAPSRAIIMRKLKVFCHDSVVLVVYHPESDVEDHVAADHGSTPTGTRPDNQTMGVSASTAVCAAGEGGFFDAVLEVREGELTPPRLCTP